MIGDVLQDEAQQQCWSGLGRSKERLPELPCLSKICPFLRCSLVQQPLKSVQLAVAVAQPVVVVQPVVAGDGIVPS